MVGFNSFVQTALVTLASAGNIFSVSISESVTTADTVSVQVTFNSSLSEALAISDNYTVPMLSKADYSQRPAVFDHWDRDTWGNFIPGSGYHRG